VASPEDTLATPRQRTLTAAATLTSLKSFAPLERRRQHISILRRHHRHVARRRNGAICSMRLRSRQTRKW
jgi:hypothetical protein